MIVTNPELKHLIFDLVTYTEEVDENGARVQRKTFPKDLLRGVREVKKSITDCLEVQIKPEEGDPIWVKSEDLPNHMGSKFLGERITDKGIELSSSALAAVKYFYSVRKELPDLSEQTLDEIEALLK